MGFPGASRAEIKRFRVWGGVCGPGIGFGVLVELKGLGSLGLWVAARRDLRVEGFGEKRLNMVVDGIDAALLAAMKGFRQRSTVSIKASKVTVDPCSPACDAHLENL